MEHRVKQRSSEWLKLRKSVPLTASQFADAVGVGMGKPFHFFQSIVEAKTENAEEDGPASPKNENIEHGEKMETVIREAYELLTGLRVQESGFWVPVEESAMHGLVGASPDGLVMSSSDTSRMIGLVEFKAPVHKLYDKTAGTLEGIPRRYMVQIQGQMAVCGAPWCDFMAVCCKTREIMLKRVYFQPRYWEHISSRLKQFCFALQEAEIMQELGRDLYSGAMTKWLNRQPMQDKLFPAEDIITVENLLSRPATGMFRGPSRKLLSFHILIGDSYILPSTLSRYEQDLLVKVDAEIQRKSSQGKGTASSLIENKEDGGTCRRVFCEMDVRSPESPERVCGEAASMFETDTVELPGDTVAKTHSGSSMEPNLSSFTSSVSGSHSPLNAVSNENVGRQTGAAVGNNRNDAPANRPPTAKPQPSNVSKTSSDTVLTPVAKSSLPGQASRPKSESALPRKLSRIGTSHRERVQGNLPRSAARGNLPRATVPGNSPRTAVSGNPRRAAVPGNPPRTAAPGSSPRKAVPRNPPRAAAPGNPPRTAVPENSSRAAVRGSSGTALPLSTMGVTQRTAAFPPRAAGSVPRSAAPRTSPGQAAADSVQRPGSSSAVTSTSSTVAGVSAQATARPTSAVKPVASTASTNSQQKTAAAQQARLMTRSAREEWEMAARAKQRAGEGPGAGGATSSAIEGVSKTATSEEAQGSQNQGPNKVAEAMVVDVAPVTASSNAGERRDSGDDGQKKGSGDQDLQRRAAELASGGSFVPPGLTLLSSESGPAEHPRKDEPSKGVSEQATAAQQSAVSTKQQEPAPSQAKEDALKSSDASPQAQKRPHTPQSSTNPDVEPKKAFLDKPVSKPDSASRQPRPSGDHRDYSRMSPERNPIHRPWQAREDGREPHPLMMRKADWAEGPRDMPRFDRGQDKPSQAFDSRDEGQRSRGWGDRMEMGRDRLQEAGHQRMQHLEDRGGPRALSAMERERAAAQSRVFDYDHLDRVVSEDFIPHHNLGLAQSDPRAIPASGARFDSLRLLPLDLSERRRHLELSERDMFAAERARSLGRDFGLGLEHGNSDSWSWRGQLQRRMQQQPMLQQLQPRPEQQASLRNSLHSSWPGDQGLRAEAQRTLELQSRLMDRRFPDLDGRDPHLGGANVDFRGDASRGQFPRGFPPGRARRHFDF